MAMAMFKRRIRSDDSQNLLWNVYPYVEVELPLQHERHYDVLCYYLIIVSDFGEFYVLPRVSFHGTEYVNVRIPFHGISLFYNPHISMENIIIRLEYEI